jgi:hypothetical protein
MRMKNKPYSRLTTFSLLILISHFCFASLPAPLLNSPFSSAWVKTFEAKLVVSPVTGATGYQFQYDTVNSFNSPGVKKDTASSYIFITQPLRTGKTYYWRARAFKPGDTSSWSGWSNFRTFTKLELSNPANGSGPMRILACSTASLTSNAVYIFEVDTVSSFSSGARVVQIQNTANFTDTSLFYFGNRLYWRATAVSALGDTLEWSLTNLYVIYNRPVLNKLGTSMPPVFKLNWVSLDLADVSLQMDTVDTFNSGFLIEKTFPAGTVSDSLYDLVFGQTYFFRLRGKYGNSISDWSIVQSTPIASTGNFNIGETNEAILFSWERLFGASVQLQFSDDSLFSQLRMDTLFDLQSNCTYPTFLGFNKKCFGRIRYYHTLDTTEWIAKSYVTTNGNIDLKTPLDRIINVDVRTRFSFMTAFWANKVVLEIDTGYSFGSSHSSYYIKIDSFGYINGFTSFVDTSLYYNQRYVWRVYGIRDADTGSLSNENTFVTKALPSALVPQANIIGVGTNPICIISGINGSTFVQWQLDTTNLFNSPQLVNGIDPHIPDPANPNNVRLNLPQDQFFNTNYYWRVRCISPIDTSGWTLISKYRTTTPIKMISPADNDTTVVIPTFLEWSLEDKITAYRFQYRMSRDSILDSARLETFIAAGMVSIQVACDFDSTYFWQIRAMHSRDTTEWTPVYRFRTAPFTGLSEQASMPDLKLYPNPTQDNVTIELTQPFSVSIYNTNGSLVFQTNQEQSVFDIDTKEWQAGLYIVKVVSNERASVQKLILSK